MQPPVRTFLMLGTLIAVLGPPATSRAQVVIAFTSPMAGATQFNFSSIATGTGVSTSISPATISPAFGGLGVTPTGQYFGTQSNNLVTVDVTTNVLSVIGPLGATLSAFDILADGRGASLPNTAINPQLYSVNLATGAATAVGEATAIRDALIAAGGTGATGALLSLGSIGSTLYTIDGTGRNLIAINADTGAASVVGGTVGLLGAGTLGTGVARSRYSAFAALTGVDTNFDGQYDMLMGAVNSFDDDDNPATPSVRLGGLARFDVSNGSWDLVGTNPGLQYSAMASPLVPEPSSAALLACAALGLWRMGRQWMNA